MRNRRWRRGLLAGAFVLVLAGCGAGDPGPLADAERAMAELDAGHIDFALSARTGAGEPARPVGFRMQGPFSVEEGQEFPTFDLRYTNLLGGDQSVVQIVSDGTAVSVLHDGARTPVPPQQARLLRLGSGDGGFTDLGVSGWLEDPVVEERADGSRRVTGRVDAADLLSDLVRISGQATGSDAIGGLDSDSARRLGKLVRRSEFVAELDAGHLPRDLRAVVDFGGQLPDALRSALGPYASPRLEVTLAVRPAQH
jgi:hypothetical protein